MLAAAPELQAAFPGIAIDALVSRQMSTAPALLRHQLRDHRLRFIVVIGLGTNGPIPPGVLDEVRRTIGPDRELVLISAHRDARVSALRREELEDLYDIRLALDPLRRQRPARGRAGETPITADFMLKLGRAAGRVLAAGSRG